MYVDKFKIKSSMYENKAYRIRRIFEKRISVEI